MKKIKSEKGITLIALVITIILLIILAGIGISIFTGEDGIVNKAKRAAQNYQSAADEEKNTLDSLISGSGEKPFIDNAGSTSFGKDTSNYDWSTSTGTEAKLDLGETVNLRLKKIAALANGVSEEVLDTWTVYNSEDTYITSIVWSNTAPTAAQKVNYGQLAMTPDSALGMDADGTTNELIVSDVPIYAWYENGTIYIWSSDTTIDMHPHSERMFQGMKNLQNISGLSHFVADNVTSVRCMFKDTNISNFTVCNDWNITKVKTSLKAGQESLPGNNGFYWMCNNTPSNSHPTFSTRKGFWDNEGTFNINVYVAKRGDKTIPMSQDFKVDYFCAGRTYQQDVSVDGNGVVFDFLSDMGNTYRAICTDKIDLTNAKRIKVEYEVATEIYGASIGIYNGTYRNDFLLSNDDSQNYAADKFLTKTPGKHVKIFDVSEYTGEYIIALTSWRGSNDIKGAFKITSIYIDDVKGGFTLPAMTSDTTTVQGFGTLRTTSTEIYDENSKPYRAFDHITNSSNTMDVWHSTRTTPQWIQLQLPVQICLYEFSIKNRDWWGRDNISQFVVYGSNDGSNWTQLTETLYNSTDSNATTEFEIQSPGYYYYYKWDTVATTTGYSIIDEINFIEAERI